MKNFFFLFTVAIIISILSFVGSSFAQEAEGNIMVVTTMETKPNPDGSMAEFDSLNQLYTNNVLKKNDLILSAKTLRHMWGHNNRDFVVMYEVKNWVDVEAANENNTKLFEAVWKTKEDRKAFWDTWNAYFTGKHSDEIYQEVKSGRK